MFSRRYSFTLLVLILLLQPQVGLAADGNAPSASTSAAMGINLTGPGDWSTEQPFVDHFRFARAWISQQEGKPWEGGPKLELDEQGWVKRLEPGCSADALVLTIEGDHYPSGAYELTYQGKGNLAVRGAASVVSRSPGRIELAVDAAKGGIAIRLEETNPADYVRNIRLVKVDPDTPKKAVFRQRFLNRWRGIATLRFMDWLQTNNNPQRIWAERPLVSDASYLRRGVPIEVMIDLSNELDADAWFCIPHLADDDYVRQFARLVKERLEPERKVYLEYSNEVWNGMFQQQQYAQAQGVKLGLGPKERPWESAGYFYGQRAVEIFRIWKTEFGERPGLVRVLAWQAADAWWSENIILTPNDVYREADALAIAPYISFNILPDGQPSANEVAKWTPEQVLAKVRATALPDAQKWMANQAAVAKKFKLKLLAYEGGQHFIGFQGGENNEALTKLLDEVNHHPQIEPLYDDYFATWKKAGGGLFCYFASPSSWSKWGRWGITEFDDSDPADFPRYRAVVRTANEWGQPLKLLAPPE